MLRRNKKLLAGLLIATMSVGLLSGCGSKKENNLEDNTSLKEINVYSARHYDVDKELFKTFEAETGIKVNLIEGKSDELIERLSREGENTKADVFLTVGAESLSLLEGKNLIEEFTSETIDENIPKEYRGSNWVGLTLRPRVIAYDKTRVTPESIKTYDDLLKPEFKGKVLVRSSSSSYNVGMLSSFLQQRGEEETKKWTEGLVNSFARNPEGNDRDQIKAIAAGTGDVAIVNSYYMSKLLNSSDENERNAAKNIGIIFPEDTFVNLSFASVVKGSKNKEEAVEFIEYLTSESPQKAYCEENGEYPANEKVQLPELLKSWGDFNAMAVDYRKLGDFKHKAVLIADEMGWK